MISGLPWICDQSCYMFPRVMDQIFALERGLGRIVGILQIIETEEEPLEFEEIPVIHSPEPKEKVTDEGEEGAEDQQPEGEEAKEEAEMEQKEELVDIPLPVRSAPKEPL